MRYDEFLKLLEEQIVCKENRSSAKNPIVMLKQSEYESIHKNAIILHNYKICNDNSLERLVEYEIHSIGSNVQTIKTEHGIFIDLKNTRHQYFYILTHCEELTLNQSSISIYSTDGSTISGSIKEKNSGYIVLSYGHQYAYNKSRQNQFDEDDMKKISIISNNQVKRSNFHFNTEGKIYSFGYAPKYCKIGNDGCSFKKFNTSKKKTYTETTKKKYIEYYEGILSTEIIYAIEMMKRFFPNIQKILSPTISILQTYFDLTDETKSKDMKKFLELGLANLHFCMNAQTQNKHTEQDQSYTVITVPQQQNLDWNKGHGANFEFCINSKCTIFVRMLPNTSFIYSGHLLTHRQQLTQKGNDKISFLNIATYCSKRLFDNMSKSFQRKIT